MLRGIVSVVSTSRRTVDDVCLTLKAEGRLALQGGPPESYVAFERSLSLADVAGLEHIQLVKGVNTFVLSPCPSPLCHPTSRTLTGSSPLQLRV